MDCICIGILDSISVSAIVTLPFDLPAHLYSYSYSYSYKK